MHITVHSVPVIQIQYLRIQTVYIIYTISDFPILILYKEYIYVCIYNVNTIYITLK